MATAARANSLGRDVQNVCPSCLLFFLPPCCVFPDALCVRKIAVRQALVQFKEDHGHCRVPMSIPELGKWAKYQRDQYAQFMRGKRNAKINQQTIDKLVSIGFEKSLEERVAMGLPAEGEGELELEQAKEEGPREVEDLTQAPPGVGYVAYQQYGGLHLGPLVGEQHLGSAYAE